MTFRPVEGHAESWRNNGPHSRSVKRAGNVRNGSKADIAVAPHVRHAWRMGAYNWNHAERRDLYLASRILAGENADGHWVQWASDTLIQDLELYSDPRQGVGSWLVGGEADTANELGECLWALVEADPSSAAEKIATDGAALRPIALRLIEQMEAHGRGVE